MELEFDLELERLAALVTATPSRSEICLNAHRSSLPVHPALFALSKIRTKTSGRNRVIAAIYWGRPLLEATGNSVEATGNSVTAVRRMSDYLNG